MVPSREVRGFGIAWLLLLLICAEMRFGTSGRMNSRSRCATPEAVPHGSFTLKRNSMLMRVGCRLGFTILGPRVIECVHGKWFGEKPVCAKKGCSRRPESPENGQVQIENEYKAILFCSDNYNLAGNRFAYCNGTQWDRQLGNCRERKNSIQHECDFETDDLCGWVFEPTESYEWKRVMAANVFTSFHTGPRHDHTDQHSASGGHYMLMESLGTRSPTTSPPPIPLMSPIYERQLSLKPNSCFRFYYFMYGASVGRLSVYVRPISITLDRMLENETLYMKFTKSGNQNNLWNEAQVGIDEMPEDFQIVFMATGGRTYLSDIAIDDVKLTSGNDCGVTAKSEALDGSDRLGETGTTEVAVYDTQSCVFRCAESTGVGFVRRNGKLYGLCNCHAECEETDSCCPDYRLVCLDELFTENIYSINDEGTTDRVVKEALNAVEATTPIARNSTTVAATKQTTRTPKTTTVSSTTSQSRTETSSTMTKTKTTLMAKNSTTTGSTTTAATTTRTTTTSTATIRTEPTTIVTRTITFPTTTPTSTTITAAATTRTSTISTSTTSIPTTTTSIPITIVVSRTSASTTQKPIASTIVNTTATSVTSMHSHKPATTKTLPKTTTTRTTTSLEAASEEGNRNGKTDQQQTTWFVDRWLINVTSKATATQGQNHYGAEMLKILFVCLAVGILIAAAWCRLQSGLFAPFVYRKESSIAVDDPVEEQLEVLSTLTATYKAPVTTCGKSNGSQEKKQRRRLKSQTKHLANVEDTTLLWQDSTDESDGNDYDHSFEGIALQKKSLGF